MKFLITLSLLLFTCCSPNVRKWAGPTVHPEEAPHTLVIRKQMSKTLSALASGLHKEMVICGLGDVHNDTAFVKEIWLAPILESTDSTASHERCPVNTVLVWHNHPSPVKIKTPELMCYLGTLDIPTSLFTEQVPFQAVAVDENTVCWWSLQQLIDYWNGPLLNRMFPFMKAYPDQASFEVDTTETRDQRLQKLDSIFKLPRDK